MAPGDSATPPPPPAAKVELTAMTPDQLKAHFEANRTTLYADFNGFGAFEAAVRNNMMEIK